MTKQWETITRSDETEPSLRLTPEALPPVAGSGTDDGSRILSKEQVKLALMRVGLGPRLINESLVELGFQLKPFPSQNSIVHERA